MKSKEAVLERAEWYQQGDVIIDPLVNYGVQFPSAAKKVSPGPKGFLIVDQATGHSHVLKAGKGVEVVEEKRVLQLADGTTQEVRFWVRISAKQGSLLSHEEHKPFVIPSGEYVIRGVREFDHFLEESRNVID